MATAAHSDDGITGVTTVVVNTLETQRPEDYVAPHIQGIQSLANFQFDLTVSNRLSTWKSYGIGVGKLPCVATKEVSKHRIRVIRQNCHKNQMHVCVECHFLGLFFSNTELYFLRMTYSRTFQLQAAALNSENTVPSPHGWTRHQLKFSMPRILASFP